MCGLLLPAFNTINTCPPVQHGDMSWCCTIMHAFLPHHNTCLLVAREDMSSCDAITRTCVRTCILVKTTETNHANTNTTCMACLLKSICSPVNSKTSSLYRICFWALGKQRQYITVRNISTAACRTAACRKCICFIKGSASR